MKNGQLTAGHLSEASDYRAYQPPSLGQNWRAVAYLMAAGTAFSSHEFPLVFEASLTNSNSVLQTCNA